MFAKGQDLHFFMCAPSPAEHPNLEPAIPPSPACANVSALLKEAVPITLDHGLRLHGKLLEIRSAPRTAHYALGGIDADVLDRLLASVKTRAVAHEPSGDTPRLRAAVCIAGLARSFHLPRVFESLAMATRSLKAETQLFYVLDLQGRPYEEFNDAFAALPPDGMVLYDESRGTGLRLPQCQWATPGHVHKLFEKLRSCFHLITAAEQEQHERFDWIVRLRPDFEWLAPIGNLREFDAEQLHIVRHWSSPWKFYDTTDFFALVPRPHLWAYFGIGCPSQRSLLAAKMENPCFGLLCNATSCVAQAECVLQVRLQERNLPVESFPPVMRMAHEPRCHPGDRKCLAGWRNLARWPFETF